MAMNFETHECVIFVQSTKIGTHEIKAIHSMLSCHKSWNWNFYLTALLCIFHAALDIFFGCWLFIVGEVFNAFW